MAATLPVAAPSLSEQMVGYDYQVKYPNTTSNKRSALLRALDFIYEAHTRPVKAVKVRHHEENINHVDRERIQLKVESNCLQARQKIAELEEKLKEAEATAKAAEAEKEKRRAANEAKTRDLEGKVKETEEEKRRAEEQKESKSCSDQERIEQLEEQLKKSEERRKEVEEWALGWQMHANKLQEQFTTSEESQRQATEWNAKLQTKATDLEAQLSASSQDLASAGAIVQQCQLHINELASANNRLGGRVAELEKAASQQVEVVEMEVEQDVTTATTDSAAENQEKLDQQLKDCRQTVVNEYNTYAADREQHVQSLSEELAATKANLETTKEELETAKHDLEISDRIIAAQMEEMKKENAILDNKLSNLQTRLNAVDDNDDYVSMDHDDVLHFDNYYDAVEAEDRPEHFAKLQFGHMYWGKLANGAWDGNMVYLADRGSVKNHIRIHMTQTEFERLKRMFGFELEGVVSGWTGDKEMVDFALRCIISQLPECQMEAAEPFLTTELLLMFEKRAFRNGKKPTTSVVEQVKHPAIWAEVVDCLRYERGDQVAAYQFAIGAALRDFQDDNQRSVWPARFKDPEVSESCSFESVETWWAHQELIRKKKAEIAQWKALKQVSHFAKQAGLESAKVTKTSKAKAKVFSDLGGLSLYEKEKKAPERKKRELALDNFTTNMKGLDGKLSSADTNKKIKKNRLHSKTKDSEEIWKEVRGDDVVKDVEGTVEGQR